jgi:PAS domain S-box-containing protein
MDMETSTLKMPIDIDQANKVTWMNAKDSLMHALDHFFELAGSKMKKWLNFRGLGQSVDSTTLASFFRHISIYAILITLVICLFHPQASYAKEQIVKAGMPENLAPQFSINSKTGKPVGFAVDVLDEVSKLSDIEIQYEVFPSWDEVNEALRNGTIDIIPNMGITAERRTRMDFTEPIETITVNLFTRASDKHLTTISDLAGHRVGVERTSVAVAILSKEQSVEIKQYENIRDAFFALLSGQVDAIADSFPVLMKLAIDARLDKRIRVLNPPLLEIKRAIAVKKDAPELLQRLNLAVEQFVKNPKYVKIYQKWYGSPSPLWTVRRISILAIVLIMVILVSLVGWRYLSMSKLNKEQQTLLNKFKQAEKEIIASKKYLGEIINNIGDPLFVKDDQHKMTLVNDAFCSIFGMTRDKIVGKTLAEDLPPDEMEHFLKIDRQILIDGQENLCEESLTVKDGKTLTIVTKKTRYVDENGHKFIIGVIRDITERKRAEKELRTHRDNLEFLVVERTNELVKVNTEVEKKVVELQTKTDELEGKTSELEKLNSFFVDRELKMVELKREIEILKKQCTSPLHSPDGKKRGSANAVSLSGPLVMQVVIQRKLGSYLKYCIIAIFYIKKRRTDKCKQQLKKML